MKPIDVSGMSLPDVFVTENVKTTSSPRIAIPLASPAASATFNGGLGCDGPSQPASKVADGIATTNRPRAKARVTNMESSRMLVPAGRADVAGGSWTRF
ncbi:MAG: hypothetical protein JF586_04200 [Burkholderiales bacterium]|nr:hypothetical protein [Burkholderiales bacterium]